MAEYIPFFDAHPELRPTSRAHGKNYSATPPSAKVSKVAKVLRPFPETLAGLAATDPRQQRNYVPPEWTEGVAQLATMRPPRDWLPAQWPVLVADAQAFLERWAGQAHRLAWQTWELFGCHRARPWGAIHGIGLVLLLGGDELLAMTDAACVMRTVAGNHQRYYRKARDPLSPSERALIWSCDVERAEAGSAGFVWAAAKWRLDVDDSVRRDRVWNHRGQRRAKTTAST